MYQIDYVCLALSRPLCIENSKNNYYCITFPAADKLHANRKVRAYRLNLTEQQY